MIFVYIIASVLKFRSDREDYLQPQPIRAVIFAFIAFVLLPIVGSVLFAAVQCYYPGGNDPISLSELLSVAATAIIARDYVFISPITFAVGLSSVALCAYCFAKFKSGTGLMIIIFSVFCIGAVVALGNCLMLVPILSMAMASMFKFTGRHRTSGIVCPISACVIFIALKAAEIIF
jgi:hypothetical protein